jgi:Mn-dependent DtxR family transcriptional regulator
MKHLTVDELKEFFESNPKATHAEAAARFGVSTGTISQRVARMGGHEIHLSDRDRAVYGFVRSFIERNLWPPSVTEIADGLQCAGSAAHNSLHRLAAYGAIEIGDGARAIRVVGSKITMKGAKNVAG